jgi:hypothetical protein
MKSGAMGEREALEQALLARLSVHHFRNSRLASLRWLAVASVPIWAHGLWAVLPGVLTWAAFLAEGYCLAWVVAYTALEHRWARRARRFELDAEVPLHVARPLRQQVGSALWLALGLASLLPWIAVGTGRSLPAELLSRLTVMVVAITSSIGLLESTGRRLSFSDTWGAAGEPPRVSHALGRTDAVK